MVRFFHNFSIDAVDDETSADLALSRETGEAKQRRQNKSRKSKVVKRRRRNDKFGRKQQKRNKKNKKVQKGKKNKLTRQQADTSSITTTDTCVEVNIDFSGQGNCVF